MVFIPYPQGCVFSPLLRFMLLTHICAALQSSNHIISDNHKFSDDMAVDGLIILNKAEHIDELQLLDSRRIYNLSLNVDKTKNMADDFKKACYDHLAFFHYTRVRV